MSDNETVQARPKPMDHLPKHADAMKPRTIEVHGITVSVDPRLLEDGEVMALLMSVQDASEETTEGQEPDEATATGLMRDLMALFRKLLPTQWRGVLKRMRDPDTGIVNPEEPILFLQDMIEALSPNSSRS